MKLSFSLPSKQSSSKPKPSQGFGNSSEKPEINHEFLTEFDPSKPQILKPAPKKLVIPPKENEWRPTKKMKNLDLPPLHSDGKPLEFEKESSQVGPSEPGSHISYGLNVREQLNNGMNNSNLGNSVDDILLKKLKTDMDKLPGDEGFEQFEEVPVEGFGEALLAGYGWKQGMGIGRNAKEDVKVVEYKRRAAKEGLGFTSESGVPVKVGIVDKGREKEGKGGILSFGVGKEVRIIGGKEVGLKGRVIEVLNGGDSLVLKLLRSGKEEEEVKVSANEVAELGSLEEEKCLRKLNINGSIGDTRGGRIKKGRDYSSDVKESKSSREERRRGSVGEVKHEKVKVGERKSSRVSWLASHIRVRIVSKSFNKGRFYLKKGEVVDVVGPMTCDISMDDGRELVQGIEQDILETALPKRGGPVLVLFGKHKGAYGSLVEKDSEREIGVVQDADTRELLHVRLEQIAEYVGDPSYIGY